MIKQENTPVRSRTICGKEYAAVSHPDFKFAIPQPFTSEHFNVSELGVNAAGLATQVNQVLAENLANNMAAKVRSAIKSGDVLPTQEDMDALYAAYDFSGVRTRGAGGTSNALFDRLFARLAGQFIRKLLKKKGYQDMAAPVTVAKRDEEPKGNQVSFDVFEAEVQRLVDGEGPWAEIPAFIEVREGMFDEAREEEAAIRDRETKAEGKISGLGL